MCRPVLVLFLIVSALIAYGLAWVSDTQVDSGRFVALFGTVWLLVGGTILVLGDCVAGG